MHFNQITSLQHPTVKLLVELRKEASTRVKQQEVLVVGKKLVLELGEHFSFKKVLFSGDPSTVSHLRSEEFLQVTDGILKKITALTTPDGLAATLSLPQQKDLSKKNYVLVLDRISDPGNLGTLFRTAWALGWEGIYLLPNTVDPFNEKALRAAKGATFHMPFASLSQDELVKLLAKEKQGFIADMHGKDFSKASIKPPLLLILSSEAHGCDPQIKKYASSLKIPMHHKAESLNVAIAGAILMQTLRGLHG